MWPARPGCGGARRIESGFEVRMTKRTFTGVVLGATALLGFVAYANTFAGDWVWDDVSSVLLHENVHQPGKFFQLLDVYKRQGE